MKDETLENNLVTLHERGWSVRRLAREFNVSRERVARILEQNEQSRSAGTSPQVISTKSKHSKKLDPHKEYIGELLEQYTKPPATNQRIFELIREKGYPGGITILTDYLSQIRGKKVEEPIFCIETAPGQRGYHDWSDYNIEFTEGGKREKVTFFSFILGYSRRQYIEVVKDKSQQTLFKCLVNTFIYFEGVVREIQGDNQKACVDRWDMGRPVFNKSFMEFATFYRFRPLAIHPGKPREDLKIERPFYYLETNFLNARTFFNKEHLKESLKEWLQEKNDLRIHRTTKQSPIDRYQEEYPFLLALPRGQYDTSRLEYRVVNNEACVECGGYYYAVPVEYLFETCPIRLSDTEIVVYSPSCEEIRRYALAEKGSRDRYIGRTQPIRGKVSLSAGELTSRLEVFGPEMKAYMDELRRHKPGSYPYHFAD